MFFRYDEVKYKEDVTSEEMTEWCEENLTNGEFLLGNISIFVESEIDAMAFKLRWL